MLVSLHILATTLVLHAHDLVRPLAVLLVVWLVAGAQVVALLGLLLLLPSFSRSSLLDVECRPRGVRGRLGGGVTLGRVLLSVEGILDGVRPSERAACDDCMQVSVSQVLLLQHIRQSRTCSARDSLHGCCSD